MKKAKWVLAFIFCGLIFSNSPCFAQWAKTYGGSGLEACYFVQQTQDSGYILGGTSDSGGGDAWVVKLDSSGVSEWQKTYGGGSDDYIFSGQQTLEGGYILGGSAKSFGAGNGDFWVLKLDSSGAIEWQKSYGKGDDEHIYYIQQTFDSNGIPNGYIAVGTTYAGGRDLRVLKLADNGNVEWDKTYGAGGREEGTGVKQTIDGGYIVVGSTNSYGAGEDDFWVLRLDSSGNIIWQKTYGGSGDDWAPSVIQTSSGGFVIAGKSRSFFSQTEGALVIKLDPNGITQWQKRYEGNGFLSPSCIQETADGYIFGGKTNSFGAGDNNLFAAKIDSDGTLIWLKTYGGSGDESAGGGIQQTADGGYVLAGHTTSFGAGSFDFLLLKLDANGEIPDCNVVSDTTPTVKDINAQLTDTYVVPQPYNPTIIDTDVIPQNSQAITSVICESPPACDLAQASPNRLWPPNHKLVPVRILGVTDPNNNTVSITVNTVTQDEPVNGLGDGDTSPDAIIQGDTVLLRAERAGNGNGRVYRITFTADDGDGGTCVGTATVMVPHDRRDTISIDDGQNYNSLTP